MDDLALTGPRFGQGETASIEPASLSVAIQLRARRLEFDRRLFTVVVPAGPGFDSRGTVAGLARALEQIYEGPVLTIHCGNGHGKRESAQSTGHGEFLVTTDSKDGQKATELVQLPAQAALTANPRLLFGPGVNVASILASPGFKEFLDRASETFRHIVVSAGCQQEHPEAAVVAQMADCLIMTVAADHTTYADARIALSRLRQCGTEVLGFLLERNAVTTGGH